MLKRTEITSYSVGLIACAALTFFNAHSAFGANEDRDAEDVIFVVLSGALTLAGVILLVRAIAKRRRHTTE